MSLFEVDDWKLLARAVVKLKRRETGLLVKCGIAACGMRKVKCGMECAESYCGTMGNMRNAESCPDSSRMRFTGCKKAGVGV